MKLEFELLPKQSLFVFDLAHTETAYVGGYGAGKSLAAAHKAIYLSALHRGKTGVVLSPTYGMTKRNLVPAFKLVNEKYKLNIIGLHTQQPSTLEIRWGSVTSTIHLDISVENYDRLNGMNLAWAGVDEIDLCKQEVAEAAWLQMGARLRDPHPGMPVQQFATSTPEGFKFLYDNFVQKAADYKSMYQTATMDNYLLPPEYIEARKRQLPKHLILPYLLGEFANLASNQVYCEYDREKNYTPLTLEQVKAEETIHIGIDFNYNGMSAVAFVVRENRSHVFWENMGAQNTKTLAQRLQETFRNRRLVVYPDPAAIAQKTSADSTDLMILRQHGLPVRIMQSHPQVQDRVNSVNARFLNGAGERMLLVNSQRCPLLTKALLKQTYTKSGDPEKGELLETGTKIQVDGPVDALGYPIFTLYPLVRQGTKPPQIQGFN